MDDQNTPPSGYASPPKAHQFQKGRSGNPKGRPRKKKNEIAVALERDSLILEAAFAEEIAREVTIKVDGQTKKVSVMQAMIRAIINNALKGDQRAQNHFIKMAQLTGKNAKASSYKPSIYKRPLSELTPEEQDEVNRFWGNDYPDE